MEKREFPKKGQVEWFNVEKPEWMKNSALNLGFEDLFDNRNNAEMHYDFFKGIFENSNDLKVSWGMFEYPRFFRHKRSALVVSFDSRTTGTVVSLPTTKSTRKLGEKCDFIPHTDSFSWEEVDGDEYQFIEVTSYLDTSSGKLTEIGRKVISPKTYKKRVK